MAIKYTSIDLLDKIEKNNYSYVNSYRKKARQTDADVEKLQKDITALKKNVRALRSYSSGVTPKSKLEKQLKNFVKSYNSMKEKTEKVTDEDILEQMSEFEKVISDNEKKLKEIGVKISDGELEFDDEVFKDAKNKNIDELFEGKNSFVNKMNKILRKVVEDAEDAKYKVIDQSISRTTHYNVSDIEYASFSVLTKEIMAYMNDCSEVLKQQNLDEENKQILEKYLIYFGDAVNVYDKADSTGNLDKIRQICKENKDNLSGIGLKFNTDETKLYFDNSSIKMDSDNFKNSFTALFGSDVEFGKKVIEYCQDTFNNIINPDKIGVSIIDTYV